MLLARSSAHTTEFTSYVFAAGHHRTDAQRELLLETCRPAAGLNRSVLEEDLIICGQARRVIEQARRIMISELSSEEQRVSDFPGAWQKAMTTAGSHNHFASE